MTRLAVAFLAVVTGLTLTGCDFEDFGPSDRFKEDFHDTLKLSSGGRIELETFNGSVEITGWDKDSVEVNATKYAATQDLLDEIRIDVSSTGDTVRIRSIRPMDRHGNMGVKYVINAPRRVTLDKITTSNGALRLIDIEGNARLKTSNGSIRVETYSGDLEATTSNGSVDLYGFRGGATLRTSNGSIRAQGVRGYFESHTSNGSISAQVLETTGGRPILAESSNGKIDLTLEQLNGSNVHASTSNSGITVRLPETINATLKASTSNSSVSTDFDVSVRGEIKKNRLEGTIGGGGPILDLQSSNGAIHVVKMKGT